MSKPRQATIQEHRFLLDVGGEWETSYEDGRRIDRLMGGDGCWALAESSSDPPMLTPLGEGMIARNMKRPGHAPNGRLQLGEAQVTDQAAQATRVMRGMKKLPARNQGDLSSAVFSAGHYAKKMQKTMYVYLGNSYGHGVWRVSDKASEYLSPINNTGKTIISVEPDLTCHEHDVLRGDLAPNSGYYVWVVGRDGKPLNEGPHGPHELEGAKTFARIAATEGNHDRAVSRGLDPESASFKIVRQYQAGTGDRVI